MIYRTINVNHMILHRSSIVDARLDEEDTRNTHKNYIQQNLTDGMPTQTLTARQGN